MAAESDLVSLDLEPEEFPELGHEAVDMMAEHYAQTD